MRGTYYTLTFQRQDRVVLATLSQRRCGVYYGGGVAEKSAQLGYEDEHFYEHDRARNRERSPYLSQKRGAMDSQPDTCGPKRKFRGGTYTIWGIMTRPQSMNDSELGRPQ